MFCLAILTRNIDQKVMYQFVLIWLPFRRILTSMTGWCKNIMSTEQKKSDFRPEEHGVGLVERTVVRLYPTPHVFLYVLFYFLPQEHSKVHIKRAQRANALFYVACMQT